MNERFVVYEYNEKASPSYRGTRFITLWTEHIEEKPDSSTTIIAQNISDYDAQILVKAAKKDSIEAFIENLPEELRDEKFSRFLRYL